MLRAFLNKSWKQHPRKQQLHGHLPPVSQAIQVRRTRHAGYRWRKKNKPISYLLQWTLAHGRMPVLTDQQTYLHQFCTDTGCSQEDMQGTMDDRDRLQKRVRELHTDSAI